MTWDLKWCARMMKAMSVAGIVVIWLVAGRNDPDRLWRVSAWMLILGICFEAVKHEARRHDEYFMRFWHKWVSSWDDNQPTMWTHTFFRIKTKYGERKVELHKMVRPDAEGRYHTHPYEAWRYILWGGYIEQGYYELADGTQLEPYYTRHRGFSSWVYPSTCHRIAGLLGRVSYSLWISGPRTHQVELKGPGWPAGAVPYYLGSVPRDKMGNETLQEADPNARQATIYRQRES